MVLPVVVVSEMVGCGGLSRCRKLMSSRFWFLVAASPFMAAAVGDEG